MSQTPDTHRFEQLLQTGDIPALLTEAYQLLVIYVTGDEDLDLEPVTSAQFLLQHALACLSDNEHRARPDAHESGNLAWHKEFVVTSITRNDLLHAGFAQNLAVSLTDSEMREIASAMEDIYCDTGFWEDLELCTNRLLKRKEK